MRGYSIFEFLLLLFLSSSFRRGFREMESLTIFVWNNKIIWGKGLISFQVCWKFVDLFERRNFELVVFFIYTNEI